MSPAVRVDLNADVGESFGARQPGDEEPMFAFVTSANVACGFHAGDPSVIAATIQAAAARGVAVGAHPSYLDHTGFGRNSVEVAAADLRHAIIYQIGALGALACAQGVPLVHVKPHGALYNDAAKNAALAATVADAVAACDRALILVGLAGSRSLEAGRAAGLRVASEAFCDRAYEPDGSLRDRTKPGALIDDPARAASQALDIALRGRLQATDGSTIAVSAQTLCVHGDTPHAHAIAAAVRQALQNAGVEIAPLAAIV